MTQIIQRSFTAGEIAPSLRSRADLIKYATGLALCENFLIRPQGGVYSRPGTKFVGEVGDSTRVARLIPFSFNTEQTYVLVFEHLKMRVVKDGAYVLAGGGPAIYELATSYTEDQLSRLSFSQSADVLTLAHPDHDPTNLGRLAEDNWSLTPISYAPSVSAPTGLSAVAVGAGAGTHSKSYRYVVTAVDENGIESIASSSVSITTGSLSVTAGVNLTWSAVSGADHYRIYKDPSYATNVFGWIGDSNNTSFRDYNKAPITSDAPPEDRRPFDGADNKPAVVGYYQQRQVFGNTNNEPQTIFTTQLADYKSMRTSEPSRDDDAITFTIAAREVNEIRHIVTLDSMIIFTSGGEWLVTEGQDQVLAPSTIGVRAQSHNGCSWVPPVVINSTVVFLQEKGARLRDLGYEFSSDKYTGNDLSLMSEHLFENHSIVEMVYAAEPYGILWCVRDDGVLLGLTYQKEHQVWGWHKHTTDGFIESITAIGEGNIDAVYMVVRREIDGNTVRYVERVEARHDDAAENAFFVDCGLSYNGSPVTSISGLDHLEGKEVAVLADGNVVKNLTVVSGAIELPVASSIVHVGLGYTAAIETLDIDVASNTSPKGKSVTVGKVIIETESSRGGWVGPKHDDDTYGIMSEIKPRVIADGYDTVALRSKKEEVIIEPQWSKGGGLRIEQRDPLPLSILSVIPDVSVGG